ncbi:glutathione S-transferase family protein [Roseibium denhamense]|uniref:Glutathione S-transferase n=1 Tax=Roseibium denhamense TaxID=76305 RepID=A0ABY1NV27_9HYPH|nr:glutathione S-transferase family protein [Roseibium denhamense]MTI08137.1 glutathione S-transferase family protein [Roseibium denhamense]SMP16676.1 glutathione S-transferase [Roseibium denhamense]
MSDFKLFIGNKNYSSWSFRPWIALVEKDIPFEEVLVPFDFENGNPEFRDFSPSMKVPVLKHGELTVWDSLAILEYLADVFPGKGLWPEDRSARAHARAISAEMHSGFGALRQACPMNMRRPVETLAVNDRVKSDVARILSIWSECLEASGGPFLFGSFTIADAMYAPVVSRFETYSLTDHAVFATYRAAMTGTKAWREWRTDALKETWIVAEDEI